MSDISKGIICNIQQTLLKEQGLESLGVLPEDTLQELLTGVILIFLTFSLVFLTFFHVGSCLFYYLVHFKAISFLISSRFEFIGASHVFRRKSHSVKA